VAVSGWRCRSHRSVPRAHATNDDSLISPRAIGGFDILDGRIRAANGNVASARVSTPNDSLILTRIAAACPY
jgi:hypothetical protein